MIRPEDLIPPNLQRPSRKNLQMAMIGVSERQLVSLMCHHRPERSCECELEDKCSKVGCLRTQRQGRSGVDESQPSLNDNV